MLILYFSNWSFVRNNFLNCRLSTLDVEFMKNLGSRVNIIPVIGKADTLTEDELAGFKARVNNITNSYRY